MMSNLRTSDEVSKTGIQVGSILGVPHQLSKPAVPKAHPFQPDQTDIITTIYWQRECVKPYSIKKPLLTPSD
jgi:hypothetical protein